ncbi:MAG: radical SAM family heme chaperone HemW [Tissierellia bacterium]|nr:radical SAM family heme chaperone HemW [Tissierellia bacterium]
MNKFGIYIHIPFCPYKCHYCDFLTFSNADQKIDAYMLALNKEISMYENNDYLVDSVFIGGGTPSYIASSYIVKMMDNLRKVFRLTKDCEISIEMNPNTLDEKKIKDYLKAGINRFSLGVQTFDDQILNTLGRSHNKQIVLADIKMLRDLGVDNLSLDMMLANPGQDMDRLKADLDIIASLDIDHISYYSLILEDRTLFSYWLDQGIIDLFDDDLERAMFDEVKKSLAKLAFDRYEISNFAKGEKTSRHNSKYWKQEPYLALGLGATSNFDGNRRKNYSKFKDYFKAIGQGKFPVASMETLSQEDREKEFIIMYMRMVKGFSIREINERFNIDFLSKYSKIIDKHLELNTVEIKDGRFSFTDYGLDVSNQFYIDII